MQNPSQIWRRKKQKRCRKFMFKSNKTCIKEHGESWDQSELIMSN